MNIFEELKTIEKNPIIAEIGGFRPEPERKSWFGRNFILNQGASWPKDDNGYMVPVIQICVSEVSNGSNYFGGSKLIQVFLGSNRLPTPTPVQNGNGWLLVEYDTIDNLMAVETPKESSLYKPFQIKWKISEQADYPCWGESWDYLDMTEINESEDLCDRFFDEFDRYSRTKIGGYGSYIQSPSVLRKNYILQIASEEKPKFMVGDNGNIYIFKSDEDDKWYLDWDCY